MLLLFASIIGLGLIWNYEPVGYFPIIAEPALVPLHWWIRTAAIAARLSVYFGGFGGSGGGAATRLGSVLAQGVKSSTILS